MKNFKNHIAEDTAVDGADFSNEMANPKTVERINAFLGAMGQIEHLVPEHALGKLRERLSRLGLTFGEVAMNEDGGKMSMPLTQFGGRTGKDENGDDINDDGISHKVEGGLSLEITHETTGNGTHFIKTKIV
jgi:hypothetical protein|tara:strand:+ start:655 stop:1050 length:396 start_codon:yes stop_codon:yes gene_type:complete